LLRLVLILFIFLSCSDPIDDIQSRDGLPDQESWGVKIILSDNGIMRAKVKSGHLEKYNEKAFILLDSGVTVDFFDNSEVHTSMLISKKAEINQNSNDMVAKDNVIAISDSGIKLFSQELLWNSKEEKLHTKKDVMITTLEKDTLYGIGFESDADLKNWKIISPSGVTNREIE